MIDRRSTGASAPRPSTVVLIGVAVTALAFFSTPAAQAEIATGPEVGTKIPDIQTLDQHGKIRSFEDLSGSEGLLILFYRTADW
jgi:hypothetical protein